MTDCGPKLFNQVRYYPKRFVTVVSSRGAEVILPERDYEVAQSVFGEAAVRLSEMTDADIWALAQ